MIEFNPFVGSFLESSCCGSSGGGGTTEDGSQANPFTQLNIKRVDASTFCLIKSNLENVVTRSQYISGVLTIDGVNTIL